MTAQSYENFHMTTYLLPGLLWIWTVTLCLFVSVPVDTSLKLSHGHSGEAQIPPERRERQNCSEM